MSKDQREIESKILPIIAQHTKGMNEAQKAQVAGKFEEVRGIIAQTVYAEKLTKLKEDQLKLDNQTVQFRGKRIRV